MATFSIDGMTMTYPRNIAYECPQVGTALSGKPIYSIYWTATLTFPTMTTTNWNAMASKFTDSASHSVVIPHPQTSSDTTYTGVYLEQITQERDLGLYVYNGQIRITRIVLA